MRYKIIITILILLVSSGYVYHDLVRVPSRTTQAIQTTLPESHGRKRIPNPVFKALDGQNHALHDFKGKLIILNFWASWCAPCIVEFPALLKLAKLYEQDIVLIAFSVDDTENNIRTFLKKHQFEIQSSNVILAHDPEKTISQDLFQTVLYPETFIIRKDLTIATKVTGVTEWVGDDMLTLIDTLTNAPESSPESLKQAVNF